MGFLRFRVQVGCGVWVSEVRVLFFRRLKLPAKLLQVGKLLGLGFRMYIGFIAFRSNPDEECGDCEFAAPPQSNSFRGLWIAA